MKKKFSIPTLAFLLLGITTIFTLNAHASCSTSPLSSLRLHGSIKPSAYVLGESFGADHSGDDAAEITGLWHSQLISEGNEKYGIKNETVLDDGYSVWHSDGTEILNSSRDPRTSSFCLGVWKEIGRSEYQLNHFTISWDGAGNYVGPGNIKQRVILDRSGNRFVGVFSIDQYDKKGVLQVHLTGRVVATRLTVESPVPNLQIQ